ncbi:glutathione S-transferase [Nostocales cyanobacterium HT-58-2]|nr:glutathione S-transferase [Nostocales cyanobacterium HT-58-2]
MKRVRRFPILIVCTSILVVSSSHWGALVMALPPQEDIPEEILRTQIVTTARSPVDGKPISAGEYAQLQAQLQKSPPPKLDQRIREQVFLLRLRKTLLRLFPFLNI